MSSARVQQAFRYWPLDGRLYDMPQHSAHTPVVICPERTLCCRPHESFPGRRGS